MNKRAVKAINLMTKGEHYFPSLYSVEKELGVNCGIVKMVCEGTNYCKSGRSKFDDYKYTFEYIN